MKLYFILLIIVIPISWSCRNSDHADMHKKILGTWKMLRDDRPSYMKKNEFDDELKKMYSSQFEFLANGTYKETTSFLGSSTASSGKYKIEHDTLYCFFPEDVKSPMSTYYYWGKLTMLSETKIEVSKIESTTYLIR